MANEIEFLATSTSPTFYAVLTNPLNGQVWNTNSNAFENASSANWTKYAITMTAVGSTNLVAGNLPSALVNTGAYHVAVLQQLGGSPATTDLNVAVGSVGDPNTTIVPATSNPVNSIYDCLNAARAQGFGKWTLVGTTVTLFAPDGATAVRTFTIDSASAPTQRV